MAFDYEYRRRKMEKRHSLVVMYYEIAQFQRLWDVFLKKIGPTLTFINFDPSTSSKATLLANRRHSTNDEYITAYILALLKVG